MIDLAVTTSMAGRIHTVDITDPYNPTVMGVARDDEGNEVLAQANDITISNKSGLVYITSGMSVYIIDIKDPNNPRLLNVVTETPDAPGSATMTSLGFSMALVEKDGWVYLANQDQGLRVLDLDPVYLKQYCDDAEFKTSDGKPSVSPKFCNDYYPALGEKILMLQGFDANMNPFKTEDRVKVRVTDANGLVTIKAVPEYTCIDSNIPSTSANIQCAVFKYDEASKTSIAKFMIKTTQTFPHDYVLINFKIDDPHEPTNLITQDYYLSNKAEVRLRMRKNSNVTFAEVLRGEAVYVNDCNDDVTMCNESITVNTNQAVPQTGNSNQNVTQPGFAYIQEMLNQVVPRKRTLNPPTGTGSYSYTLIDEGDVYSAATSTALAVFKSNFNLGVNSLVGPYPYGGSADDNTSQIFRKLMKDYGRRQTGSIWLIGGTGTDSWLHKVVDKDTLIKSERRIPQPNEQVATDNADVIINGLNGN